MFDPFDKEGGVLRFQTNSMSFYQKMNIRQNCIEGDRSFLIILLCNDILA